MVTRLQKQWLLSHRLEDLKVWIRKMVFGFQEDKTRSGVTPFAEIQCLKETEAFVLQLLGWIMAKTAVLRRS
ncbi:hypothetical protein MTO96_039392 [Rhipicephalus appendiculatus]